MTIMLHVSICARLVLRLIWFLLFGTSTWIIMAVRLICFTALMLPGWFGMVRHWLFSPAVVRNVEYGLGAKKRNVLDVYLPASMKPITTSSSRITRGGGEEDAAPAHAPASASSSASSFSSASASAATFSSSSEAKADAPVVIFVTGGAWIIGYKVRTPID